MATASTQKLQDLVQCPICLETLTNPTMLSCHHFYCKACVHGLKEAINDDQVGFECPVCRKFTRKDTLQKWPIMGELLEVFDLAKTETTLCGHCDTEIPKWRCLDCKDNLCDVCRSHHDRFKLFQSHKWEVFGDSSKPIVDKIVFCRIHSTEPVKIHCKDCTALICLICNGTTHKQHTAETIEEALAHVIPIVKENQEKVKDLIQVTKCGLTEGRSLSSEAKAKYDVIRSEVKTKYEENQQKLDDDYSQIKKEIDISEEENLSKRDEQLRNLELKLQSQESALHLSESTLNTAQNTSLLMAIQSGVLESLQSSHSENDETPKNRIGAEEVVFKARASQSDNTLGTLVTEVPEPPSDEILYAELMKKEIKLMSNHKMDGTLLRLAYRRAADSVRSQAVSSHVVLLR